MWFFGKDDKECEIDDKEKIEQEIVQQISEYAEKYPDVVPFALKKCLESMSFITDIGYIEIAYNNIKDMYYVGDILLHSNRSKLKPGDIVQHYEYSSDGDSYVLHSELKSFDKNGFINVRMLHGTEEYYISSNSVLGVLIKIISFDDPDWIHLFENSCDDYNQLKENITGSIDFIKSHDTSDEDKEERISELNKRLEIIEKRISE